MLRRIALIAISVLALLFVAMLGVGFYGSQMAELHLSQTTTVVFACTEFVTENKRWPDRWSDLVGMKVQGEELTSRDIEKLSKSVSIDFDCTVCGIAKADMTTFEGIHPLGICYQGYRTNHFPRLQQACVSACDEDENPGQ